MLLVQLKVAKGAHANVLGVLCHSGEKLVVDQWQGCSGLGIFPTRLHLPLLKTVP